MLMSCGLFASPAARTPAAAAEAQLGGQAWQLVAFRGGREVLRPDDGLKYTLASTRALCSSESLHDRILRLPGCITSYTIADGHRFLSLMPDGGVFEFAPVPATKPPV